MGNTLLQILKEHAEGGTSTKRGYFSPPSNNFNEITYQQMARNAFAIGGEIKQHNTLQRKICLLIPTTPFATVMGFYGAISAGLIPVIAPSPKALSNREDLNEKIRNMGNSFGDDFVVLLDKNFTYPLTDQNLTRVLPFQLPVFPDPGLDELETPVTTRDCLPGETAFFQFTSASTGNSKAIAITHENIIFNTKAIKDGSKLTDNEVLVSWLPLYHDMGLVGAELFSLINNYALYIMSPFDFLKRPSRWLKAIGELKATLIGAPNFAYEYITHLISDDELATFDLSSIKLAFNGAEPIQINTLSKFLKKFSAAGLHDRCISPSYGLAETTLAATLHTANEPSKFVQINPLSIGIGKRVQIIVEGVIDKNTPTFHGGSFVVSVGKPVHETKVWLVDEGGDKIEEELISGEVCLSGPSLAQGYLKDGTKSVIPFKNNILKTGDIAFFYKGDLYVMERIKNIIIRNGENYLATDLEVKIAELTNIPFDKIAVFESDILKDSAIIALIELPRAIKINQLEHLFLNLELKIDLPINKFIFTRDKAIPKTTSGKKKHYLCREAYKTQTITIEQEFSLEDLRGNQRAMA